MVHERTGDKPFARIEDVMSREEMLAITGSYKRVAGYDLERLRAANDWKEHGHAQHGGDLAPRRRQRGEPFAAFSDRIWGMPELAYAEHRSCAEHTAMLEARGLPRDARASPASRPR